MFVYVCVRLFQRLAWHGMAWLGACQMDPIQRPSLDMFAYSSIKVKGTRSMERKICEIVLVLVSTIRAHTHTHTHLGPVRGWHSGGPRRGHLCAADESNRFYRSVFLWETKIFSHPAQAQSPFGQQTRLLITGFSRLCSKVPPSACELVDFYSTQAKTHKPDQPDLPSILPVDDGTRL